jgi:hypothetical protein
MRNKLKILFGYFRGLKVKSVETYINFIDLNIEDWNKKFTTSNEKIKHEPPQLILDIIKETIKENIDEIDSENYYGENDYWTLYVTIYPWENRINFKSECEYIHESEYRKSDFTNLVPTRQLDNLKFQYFEIKDKELEKFKFNFSGSWEGTTISNKRMNGEIIIYDDFDDTLVDLTDDIMLVIEDMWWAENEGTYGTIIYSENQFYIHYWKKEKDYEMTELDFNITLENNEE